MSIGCYKCQDTCGYDVFVETITPTQCTNAELTYPVLCDSLCSTGYNAVSSNTSMTIEICLQMCITFGFKYAGLCT